jgi:FAD/FMN-containing dehydrogenase
MEASDLDPISQLVTVDTDQTIAQIDEQLVPHGWTLNYHGLPHNDYLLADVLNQRIPNLYGEAFGGIEELCIQIRLAQSDGSLWVNRLTPRSSTGPDLKKLAIGSGQSLGIPVQAVLRIFPLPEVTRVACLLFPQANSRGLFQNFLKRHRLGIPLQAVLEAGEIRDFLEEPVGREYPLGLALWGNSWEVEAAENILEERMENQKGEIFWLNEKNQDDFLEFLHEAAIREWKNQQQAIQEPLDPGYQRLLKKIMEIS